MIRKQNNKKTTPYKTVWKKAAASSFLKKLSAKNKKIIYRQASTEKTGLPKQPQGYLKCLRYDFF